MNLMLEIAKYKSALNKKLKLTYSLCICSMKPVAFVTVG